MNLTDENCVPCHAGSPPLEEAELRQLFSQLAAGWEIVEGHHLAREYRFGDFREALAFANRVGEVAEEQGHHPEIHLGWGHARIEIFTHAIDGLSRADFVLAAKLDRVDD